MCQAWQRKKDSNDSNSPWHPSFSRLKAGSQASSPGELTGGLQAKRLRVALPWPGPTSGKGLIQPTRSWAWFLGGAELALWGRAGAPTHAAGEKAALPPSPRPASHDSWVAWTSGCGRQPQGGWGPGPAHPPSSARAACPGPARVQSRQGPYHSDLFSWQWLPGLGQVSPGCPAKAQVAVGSDAASSALPTFAHTVPLPQLGSLSTALLSNSNPAFTTLLKWHRPQEASRLPQKELV